jgi:hypothetical protein
VFRILLSILMVLPALTQSMDCKCRQVEGQEYTCKCMASGATMLPASVNFTAPVEKFVSTSATPTAATPAKTGSAAATPANTTTTSAAKSATEGKQTTSAGGIDTGRTTPTGKEIYEGPRGGQYHISTSGKKVYERKK